MSRGRPTGRHPAGNIIVSKQDEFAFIREHFGAMPVYPYRGPDYRRTARASAGNVFDPIETASKGSSTMIRVTTEPSTRPVMQDWMIPPPYIMNAELSRRGTEARLFKEWPASVLRTGRLTPTEEIDPASWRNS